MSFFTQASFVMDPNVYGVGKLYVPKPGDGSADLNFTRASSGTRINKNGYIERARTNLFTQSNDFNHSSWAKTDSVVTGGQPGYDGTNDAWKLEITSNSGRLVKTVSINNLNCISFYVKAGSLGFVRLHLNVSQHPIADFDLSNGTVANSNIGTATSVYATSVDMGNGWYRVSLVTDVAGSIIELYPMVAANNLGATSGYIYIQDAQLEAGTVASNYIDTTSSNLLLQSNTFSTTWSAVNASVTGGQTGYDGTNAAWKLESTLAGVSASVRQFIAINGVSTYSVYAKAGNVNFINLYCASSGTPFYAWFNLSTGAVATTAGDIDTSITSVGGGWYRVTLTGLNPNQRVDIYPANTNGSYITAVGEYIYIQDAQLNYGLVATDYVETTNGIVTVGPFNNIPRLNYGADGCPALLLEPQRTNMFSKSDYFSLWGDWITIQTILLINRAQSPEGYLNATLIEESSANSEHKIYRTTPMSVSSSYVYTLSVFAKSGGRNVIRFLTSDGILSKEVFFNLSTGSVGTSQYMDSAKMEDYGNGWYRCSATFYNLSSTMDITLSNALDDETIVYTGASSKRLYLYGIQLEQSNYVTSYIPTVGASATRITESCYKTGASALIGQTEGTIFWEIQVNTPIAAANENILNIDNGVGFGNTMYISKGADGKFYGEIYVSATAQAAFVSNVITAGRYKCALAYANNNSAFFVNGVQVGATDTSCSVPATSRIQIGNGALGPSDNLTKQLILFPTRLSNADLARLTSL